MRLFPVLNATVLILSSNVASAFGPAATNTFGTSRRSGRRFRWPDRPISNTRVYVPRSSNDDNDLGEDMVLENEEPLSLIFQRGVVLQRSGDHEGALKEYKFFIKAAEGCGVSPNMFAEVHVNIGAVYFKDILNEELAKHHFELAIGYRPIGTAYVNLALIALRNGSNAGASDPATGRACLEEAQSLLEKAIELDDSKQSKTAALRLLEDVQAIMKQMNVR
jgi:tetratricopeptide (TPR) repeat protein